MNILVRKSVALLVAVTVIGGLAMMPAGAAPVAHDAAMAAEGDMHCGQSAPMPEPSAPCDQGTTCIGMLGCAAQLPLPTVAALPTIGAQLQSVWPPTIAPDGLARQPALPPPIV